MPHRRVRRSGKLHLPDFIGIGPPRTGTTWLDRILRGHVNLPERLKETQFFNLRYSRGLEWYSGLFANQRREEPVGEFSPSYFASAVARARIAAHLPNSKIICTLREPVARFYSNYRMWRKLSLVRDDFPSVVERHQDLLGYTQYASHIAAWQELFGRENVLVLIHEEALHDRQAYVDRLCQFIGASRLDLATVAHLHEPAAEVRVAPRSASLARRARQLRGFLVGTRFLRLRQVLDPVFEFCMGRGEPFPPLEHDFVMRLRTRFEPEIASLEELLGRDLSLWRDLPIHSYQRADEAPRTSVPTPILAPGSG